MRKRCAHRRCNTPVSWLLHRSRSLQQRDPSYTNATTNITNFPYAGCDNDLGHSPLRLIYLSSTYQPNGQNTFCWTVSLATNTQCTTNNPDGTCCRQDLGSVEIEIREYNNSPHASLHAFAHAKPSQRAATNAVEGLGTRACKPPLSSLEAAAQGEALRIASRMGNSSMSTAAADLAYAWGCRNTECQCSESSLTPTHPALCAQGRHALHPLSSEHRWAALPPPMPYSSPSTTAGPCSWI